MFWHSRRGDADQPIFLVDDVGSLTYQEFFRAADSLFLHLPRSVVAIVCGKNRETILGYVGALRAGLVPLLIDGTAKARIMQSLAETYSADFIFSPANLAIDGYQPIESFGEYNLQAKKRTPNLDRLNPDLAVLIPTSGSTGDPKSVRLSQINIDSATASIGRYLGLDNRRRAISLLPLQYSYGLSVLNSIMQARGSFVVTDLSPITRKFWDIVVEKGVTDISAVPFIFESIKRMRFSVDILTTLKCVTQAGGRLAPATTLHFLKTFAHHNIDYFTMYGSTEASPRISFLHPADAEAKNGSVGKPLDIGSVSLIDQDQGTSVGELVYSGPNVCLGYASNRSDLAKGDEFQGSFPTGDLARIDEDGFIYITGRLKRLVKIHGVSVNLVHIESTLREANFDLYISGGENRISLISTLDIGDQVLQFVADRFSFHQSVWRFLKVDRIPRTSSDKIDYASLGKIAAE